MTTDHMDKLEAEYPSLFGTWCISAYVEPGWVSLLRPCLDVLQKYGCVVGQIKQKYCGLRVYWDPPDDGLPKEATDEINRVIERAERLALQTCERCGARSSVSDYPKAGMRLCIICMGAP